MKVIIHGGFFSESSTDDAMKKAKQEKQFAAQLKKGDKVITTGGIHGRVLELNDDGTCVIECGAGKIKFERAAISMEKTAKINAPEKEKK